LLPVPARVLPLVLLLDFRPFFVSLETLMIRISTVFT